MKTPSSLPRIAVFVGLMGLLPSIANLQQAQAAGSKPNGPRSFFIIAPEQFFPALAEYVGFKRELRSTTLVSLERILGSTDGMDDPERLKRFLYDAWRNERLGYVLLVGNVDVMPVRYMVLDRITPAAFDYAFYPSDLYYSDLARRDGSFDDWNASKEGYHAAYFGEVHGEKSKNGPINYDRVDYLPEIAVGRWPVSTPAEVQIVANKSMVYEDGIRSESHPGMRRVAFFNPAGYRDYRDTMTNWARHLPLGWTTQRFFYSDDKRPFHTPPPTGEHVTAAINRGAALIVHEGHGSPRGWARSFNVKNMRALDDADRLPVMISAGCSTASFVQEAPYEPYVDVDGHEHPGTKNKEVFRGPPAPPAPYQKPRACLGSQLLKRGENGAVVYIGCNTGAQPCASNLVEGFLAALNKSEQPLVGDCWSYAIRYYYQKERLGTLAPTKSWLPPSIFFQGMKFMFFGDPTLPFARMADTER